MATPAPCPNASNHFKEGETGQFFDDYCNRTRISEFEGAIAASPVAQVAAGLMR